MASEQDERLQTELSLLEAMYGEQLIYNQKAREITYTASEGATLKLRLPDEYLSSSLPEVLSANSGKRDLRDTIKAQIQSLPSGEEILDSVLSSFNDLVENIASSNQPTAQQNNTDERDKKSATVIIWLHHLLNTNKRKLCLSPSPPISGLTKPGYPGALLYSGPSKDIQEHITSLKAQNWAAFQLRYESDEKWEFVHGEGIVEVEAMKDVVAGIVGEERRGVFLEAMKIK